MVYWGTDCVPCMARNINWSRNVSDLGDCLLSMLEALDSIPSIAKKSLQVYNPTFKRCSRKVQNSRTSLAM